jgi:hypothetical protein
MAFCSTPPGVGRGHDVVACPAVDATGALQQRSAGVKIPSCRDVASQDRRALWQTRSMSSACASLRRSAYEGQALRVVASALAGAACWIAIGLVGLFVLRVGWSAYAAAEPTKAYTLTMLLSRLAVASVGSIASGSLAVMIAKGDRTAACWLGALLFLGSAPVHLPGSFLSVWADYPAWYHAVYLLSLMPLTGLGGCLARARE